MIHKENNYSLKSLNTFGIDAKTKHYIAFDQMDDIFEVDKLLSELTDKQRLVLGGGSNILFTKDFEGVVVQSKIDFIQKISETEERVVVEVGSGMVWDDFVSYCVNNNWGGTENLSAIPGVIGAAPVQNIGAYGVEAKDVIRSVKYWDFEKKQVVEIDNESCHFGYRDSIFKNELKGKTIVLSVLFDLSKKDHKLNLSYGALKDLNESDVDLRTIREKVVEIRDSKLPDPVKIGNGGSFFKNPILEKDFTDQLLQEFPEMVTYKVSDTKVKVAAGWLIEQAGWKGYSENHVGVHDKQSLVLVNHGGAKGEEIVSLSQKIINDIYDKFKITLHPEVIFI